MQYSNWHSPRALKSLSNFQLSSSGLYLMGGINQWFSTGVVKLTRREVSLVWNKLWKPCHPLNRINPLTEAPDVLCTDQSQHIPLRPSRQTRFKNLKIKHDLTHQQRPVPPRQVYTRVTHHHSPDFISVNIQIVKQHFFSKLCHPTF